MLHEVLQDRAALLRAPSELRLTTDEVAMATGLSPTTLRTWASKKTQGKLLPTLKRAGRNLYAPDDVRAWLEIPWLGVEL